MNISVSWTFCSCEALTAKTSCSITQASKRCTLHQKCQPGEQDAIRYHYCSSRPQRRNL